MGVGIGHDKPLASGAAEPGAEPALPAGNPLDFIEAVDAVRSAICLECTHHHVERGVVECRGEPRILKIDEQAAAAVEPVAIDKLAGRCRFARPAHSLDEQGNVRPKFLGKPDGAGNGGPRRSVLMAPIGDNTQKFRLFMSVGSTQHSWTRLV
jgi:hypothetical protein